MVELLKKEDYRFNSREPFFPCCIKAQKFILFPVGRSTVNIFFNPLSSCMCNSFRLSFLHFASTCKLHAKYMQIQRTESHEVVRSFRQQIFVCLIKLKKDMTTGQSTGIRGLSHNLAYVVMWVASCTCKCQPSNSLWTKGFSFVTVTGTFWLQLRFEY